MSFFNSTFKSRRSLRGREFQSYARNSGAVSISAIAIASVLFLVAASAAFAAPPGKTQTRATAHSLDEQVQEIKSDVLAIAAELRNLEEKLLYPSDSQVALFVAFTKGERIELGSARILIDGEIVAQHVYSFKELEALAKGGVQRIYTGNLVTGAHRLEVVFAVGADGDKGSEAVKTVVFEKAVDPKLITIKLVGGLTGGASVEIEDS